MNQLTQTILSLCRLPGISGWEDAVRGYIRQELAPCADEILEDSLGNLLVFRKGRQRAAKRIVLAAHMDEVGLMVRSITDDGFLRFGCVGGIDRRVIVGKEVYIGEEHIPGVIGMKPIHLTTQQERQTLPQLKDLYIDIGAQSRQEAEALVTPGDYAVFSDAVTWLAGGEVCAKALDDRVGCGILLELAREMPPVDLWFAFTVQEEVGTRGANAVNARLNPDIAIVVEGTTSADSPVSQGANKVCVPGKGPVIPFMDRGTISDRALFAQLRALAEENQIPWQTKSLVAGGTDAKVFQRSGPATQVCGVSAAVRYIHSGSSVGNVQDFDHMKRLLELFLQSQEEHHA